MIIIWEQLLSAINNKNESEALKLIDLMKSEDFHKNDKYTSSCQRIPLHMAARNVLEKVVEKLLYLAVKYKNYASHCSMSLTKNFC